jgi:type I restriction enzyme M protein
VFEHEVLVPRYFDDRWNADMRVFCAEHEVETASLDDLITEGVIHVTGGHGSPSNDQRTGDIPYVKVSDVRSLRVNVNPTNLVSRVVAESFWGASASGLAGWDLVTPNRASSNIGEFAILLPGEEQIVLTKEVFVIRVVSGSEAGWDPFYLLWAFCLRAVRRQWQRVTLMQTNREDVGDRFREVLVPRPKSKEWATSVSAPFRNYFTTLATAKAAFVEKVRASKFDFIANVKTAGVIPETAATDDQTPVTDQPSA